MKRLAVAVVSIAVITAAFWLLARPGSHEALGQVPPEKDRLSYSIMAELVGGGSSYKTCYFDAKVALSDGKVSEVDEVAAVEANQVQVGLSVQDLQSGLQRGRTVPLPVHFAGDGKLHAGYDYCKEEPAT